jgi:nucleoside 2-deoxyribosyltransferase
MTNLVIYAAGPIDMHTDTNWRETLVKRLADAELPSVVFDPSSAYKMSMWGTPAIERSEYIEAVNKIALEQSNIFIAHIPDKVQTIGTPIELDWAYQGTQHVLLLTNIPKGKSVYLDTHVEDRNWFAYDEKTPLSNALDEAVLRMQAIYFGSDGTDV